MRIAREKPRRNRREMVGCLHGQFWICNPVAALVARLIARLPTCDWITSLEPPGHAVTNVASNAFFNIQRGTRTHSLSQI